MHRYLPLIGPQPFEPSSGYESQPTRDIRDFPESAGDPVSGFVEPKHPVSGGARVTAPVIKGLIEEGDHIHDLGIAMAADVRISLLDGHIVEIARQAQPKTSVPLSQ